MESKKIMVWIIIGLFALGGLGMMSFSSFNNGGSNSANTNKQQGESYAQMMARMHPGQQVESDLFKGRITNVKTTPGNISGTGEYDRTCKGVGNGLTNCDAGIKTKKYGVLNFNYVHNMATEPCITSGDKLQVEILDSKGTARVQRID